MLGQTNINTCIMSELNNQNINVERNKIVSKSTEKLLKYLVLFKEILTFLGLDYRYASLTTMYFVVLGISIPKIRLIG